jgi:predicted TIM-barrel fold metal-dependent hydrolase
MRRACKKYSKAKGQSTVTLAVVVICGKTNGFISMLNFIELVFQVGVEKIMFSAGYPYCSIRCVS